MKIWKSTLFTAALFLAGPRVWADDSTTTSTTSSSTDGGPAPASVNDSSTVIEHHDYDDGSRHLTLSVGADGMFSNAKVSTDSTGGSAHANPAFGYGLMGAIELGLADHVGIAAGLHLDERRFQISGDAAGTGVKWVRNIPTITVPVELRLYALKLISFGVGGFAAFPIGSAHDTFSDGSGDTVDFAGTKRKGVDFGLTAALGANLPIGDTLGLFAEARYNYGLTNSASNSALEEKIRDLLFTVGVKVKL